MIVTRQRRKPFPWKRLLLPLVAIVLLAFALVWGPSRGVISNGPMAPAWRTMGNWFDVVATPFHWAAQNEVITDRGRQIVLLQSQLTSAQAASNDKDKKIADLQQQLNALQTQMASSRSAPPPAKGAKPGAAPRPAASGAFGAAAPNDLAANASPEMQRTAQYWAAMDPDNASKVIQRLPPSYAARVLALMPTDAAGAILDALPATYAAKLTQEHPELAR